MQPAHLDHALRALDALDLEPPSVHQLDLRAPRSSGPVIEHPQQRSSRSAAVGARLQGQRQLHRAGRDVCVQSCMLTKWQAWDAAGSRWLQPAMCPVHCRPAQPPLKGPEQQASRAAHLMQLPQPSSDRVYGRRRRDTCSCTPSQGHARWQRAQGHTSAVGAVLTASGTPGCLAG